MFVAAGMYDGVGVKVVRPWIKAHARLAKVRDALDWAANKATRIASYFEGVARKFKSRARGIEERNYLPPPWTEPKKTVFYARRIMKREI